MFPYVEDLCSFLQKKKTVKGKSCSLPIYYDDLLEFSDSGGLGLINVVNIADQNKIISRVA